jgi:hypothetical protein
MSFLAHHLSTLARHLSTRLSCLLVLSLLGPTTGWSQNNPALVTPPDLLLEDDSAAQDLPDEVEDETNTEDDANRDDAAPNGQAISPGIILQDTGDEDIEILDARPTTPMPQIQRKKETIDPRFRQERRYIEHPNASKGLIKIDKEKVYHYKVKGSEQNGAASMRIGTYTPTKLTSNRDSSVQFEDIYEDNNYPIILFDQEKQIYQGGLGKLGWKYGLGLYVAQGSGYFVNGNPDPDAVPLEKFTFLVFPLNVGAVYRMQFTSNQWIIPYVEGGLDGMAFAEFRDDDQNPGIGAALGLAPAAHGSGGVSIPLGRSSRSFLDLDREYGINSLQFTIEYRAYIALSDKYDFSGNVVSAGLTAEY